MLSQNDEQLYFCYSIMIIIRLKKYVKCCYRIGIIYINIIVCWLEVMMWSGAWMQAACG